MANKGHIVDDPNSLDRPAWTQNDLRSAFNHKHAGKSDDDGVYRNEYYLKHEGRRN